MNGLVVMAILATIVGLLAIAAQTRDAQKRDDWRRSIDTEERKREALR